MPRRGFPLEGHRAGGISRLAEQAGIPQATMSRLVHGTGEPSVDTLRKLGPIFGKTLAEMMVIAGLAEPDEMPTPASTPRVSAEDSDVSGGGLSVTVTIEADLTLDEALKYVVADGGPLSQNERILVANLDAMDYPANEIAGAIKLLRRFDERKRAASQRLREA